MMRVYVRLVCYALCVVPLLILIGCSSGSGGGCSMGSVGGDGYIPPQDYSGLFLYGTAVVDVGDEITVNARYRGSYGEQIPDFWPNHAYSITHEGLGYIDDVGLLNPDGTAYARYRAVNPGTFYVVWTVYADKHTTSAVLGHATFTVTVRGRSSL